MRANVLEELSLDRLHALLLVPSEESSIDFKESLGVATPRGVVEFAKDVLSFANSGGGHLVVGVTDGKPRTIVGLPESELRFFSEPKRVNDALRKYTGGHITVSAATHTITTDAQERIVGIVYVPGRSAKVPAQDNGSYPDPVNPKKQTWAFRKGDVYIRKGDQSCKVETPEDLLIRTPLQVLPIPSTSDLSTFPNPYDVATAAHHMFKGRDREIEMLLDSIETGTHTAVFGLQRIGKTSLVTQVLRAKLNGRPALKDRVLFAMVDFQSLGNDYTYRSFLHSLVQAVAKNVPNVSAKEVSNQIALFTSQYERGSKQEMLVGFSGLLERLASRSRKKIVIFLDEFSELCRAIERNEQRRAATSSRPSPMLHPHELPVDVDLMHWFSFLIKSETCKNKLVFLLAVRPFVADYDHYRNLQIFKLTKSITLYHLDDSAARALITEPVDGKVSYTQDAVDYLCCLTANHPYLLQMFLREVVDRLKRERRHQVVKKDIQDFEEGLISEGPAHEAQFKVLNSDYSIDDVINPERAKFGRGTLAIIAKFGHDQREGWVNIENVCQFVAQYGYSREDTYASVDQLVGAKILEEKQLNENLVVRMSIPLLRKRYVRQNMYLKYFRTRLV